MDEHIQLIQTLVEKERELFARGKNAGIYLFKPFPKQVHFFENADKRWRLVRCGNRFGKTTIGVVENISYALGFRPFFEVGDPRRTRGIPQGRPLKVRVIASNWKKVDETLTNPTDGKFTKFLPRNRVIETVKTHDGYISGYTLDNGSQISVTTVQSFLKDPKSSESSDWDVLHIDEPCPREMYIAESRGLVDRDGCGYFTLTPLSELWINDMFIPSENEKVRQDTWWMDGSMDDNPTNTQAAIEAYMANLSVEEQECRRRGIPLELTGLVYKGFDKTRHVLSKPPEKWTNDFRPPSNYTIYVSIDPHPQVPTAVLFVAVSEDGKKYVYDEIFEKLSPGEMVDRITYNIGGRPVGLINADPLAWMQDMTTTKSLASEWAQHGLVVEKASKALAFGIMQVNRLINAFPQELYVSPKCSRFIWEISRYMYDKENKPRKKDDHLMECFYRIILNNPQYIPLDDYAEINMANNSWEYTPNFSL